MPVSPSGRRATLVATLWSILLLLQRLPWLAAAAASATERVSSPTDPAEEGRMGTDEQSGGGGESASATGAEGRQQQQQHHLQQQLGRRSARMRRFLSRGQMAPVLVTSSTGYNLAINDDEQVYGVASDTSPYVRMRQVTIDAGLVALQAVETGLYLGINDEGFVIATQSITEDNYLIETLEENLFTTYKWYKYHLLPWYLSINRKGRLPRYRLPRHHGNPSAAAVATAAEDRTLKQSEMFLVRPIVNRTQRRHGFT